MGGAGWADPEKDERDLLSMINLTTPSVRQCLLRAVPQTPQVPTGDGRQQEMDGPHTFPRCPGLWEGADIALPSASFFGETQLLQEQDLGASGWLSR